jgi:hypothetical protein
VFCDEVTVDVGGVKVLVKRLTVKELRESRAVFATGTECLDEAYTRLIAEHCRTADGKGVDAAELSLPQLQKLAKELAGVPEGSPLSDFIGLLC